MQSLARTDKIMMFDASENPPEKKKKMLLRETNYNTDLLKVSGILSALRSRENMFPNTGRDDKRGPGGMFLNS